jgi:hypothetical protein
MISAWAHLPNSSRIDWVLNHSKKYQEKWGNPYNWENADWVDRVRRVRRIDRTMNNRYETFNSARSIAHKTMNVSFTPVHPHASYCSVCMTLAGLVAWDNIDYLLDSEPKAFEIFVGLEVEPAVLLQVMHHILHT